MLYTIKILICCFFLFSNDLYSQKVLVSEYYNASRPTNEWVELLVIGEKVNLSNYILRDNSITGLWQGGIRFNNVKMFQNVRAGTIIVIHFRGESKGDTDPNDGYLELYAENPDYFTKVNAKFEPQDWHIGPLNLSKHADIVQILDNSYVHVHALSHMKKNNIALTKLHWRSTNYQGELLNNSSLSVFPGTNSNDYVGKNKTHCSTIFTQGTANIGVLGQLGNYIYWNKLKVPVWLSPFMTIQKNKKFINIAWEPFNLSAVFKKIDGYVLAKIELSQFNNNRNITPKNGIIYNEGEKFGEWNIVYISKSKDQRTFTDKAPDINKEFVYRAFAFGFENTDILHGEYSGRGRIYNQKDIAERNIIYQLPEKPVIKKILDKDIYCKGDIVQLKHDYQLKRYLCRWYVNGKKFSTDADVIVSKPGRYKLTFEDESTGLISESEEIEIKYLDVDHNLVDRNGILRIDTTINICRKKGYLFRVDRPNASYEYIWMHNNTKISNALAIEIVDEGEYCCIAKYLGCADTSNIIRARTFAYEFQINKKELVFDKIGDIRFFSLSNSSAENIILTHLDVQVPLEFSMIISQKFPFIIKRGQSIQIGVRYEGGYIGKEKIIPLKFNLPCSVAKILSLVIKNTNTIPKFITSTKMIDFKTINNCEEYSRDIKITNTNTYNIDLEIEQENNSIFDISFEKSFQNPLKSNMEIALTALINTKKTGVYSENIKLISRYQGKQFILTIPIKCEIVQASYTLSPSKIMLPDINPCKKHYYDTCIVIENTSKLDITFSEIDISKCCKLTNTPLMIPAMQTDTLYMRFFPTNNPEIVHLISNPCSVIHSIEFDGKLVKNMITVDKKHINLGVEYDCSNQEIIQTVTFESINHMPSYISTIDIDSNYEVNLKEGEKITDGRKFTVRLKDKSIGKKHGQLKLEFAPCKNLLEIEIKSEVKSLKNLVCKPSNNLDIYNIKDNNVQIVLENTNEVGIEIRKIKSKSNKIDVSDNIFPIIIPKQSSNIVKAIINAKNMPDQYQESLLISYVKPCLKDVELVLKMKSKNIDNNIISVDMPKNITLDLNKIEQVPIDIFIMKNAFNTKNDVLSIFLEYDSMLLDIKKCSSTDLLVNIKRNDLQTSLLKLDLEVNKNIIEEAKITLLLEVQALRAAKEMGKIVLNQLTLPNTYNLNIKNDKIMFKIVGVCNPDNSELVQIIPNRISVVGSNPIDDNSRIVLERGSRDDMSLTLYTSFGRVHKTYNIQWAKQGKNEYKFPLNLMDSGVYYLVLKVGTEVKSQKLIYFK